MDIDFNYTFQLTNKYYAQTFFHRIPVFSLNNI